MIFLDAVAYILQKEGNKAKIKEVQYGNMEIFSARHPADKKSPTLYSYVMVERSIPMPLNINSDILGTHWEII